MIKYTNLGIVLIDRIQKRLHIEIIRNILTLRNFMIYLIKMQMQIIKFESYYVEQIIFYNSVQK